MLWRMAAGVGLVLAAVLGVPWLREVLDLAAPGAAELAAIGAALAGTAAWLALQRGWSGRRAVAAR
jgi:Ca2+-transporting ATPase